MSSELLTTDCLSGTVPLPGLAAGQMAAPEPTQEERLSALARMSRAWAHDLNNSLTPIIGYADVLLDPRWGLSEEVIRCLRCIRTAADDVTATVGRVRRFYRPRERYELLTSADLGAICQDAVERSRREVGSRDHGEDACIRVVTRMTRVPLLIRENEEELREAIDELMENAMDAMPTGGVLRVTTRLCREFGSRGDAADGVWALLEVQDTGVGMDAQTQEHCLEPFFSTKRVRGSGLGLAMVHGLMRRHTGRIEIESEVGLGTTVRLFFHAVTQP
jgi:signal transduction histidine kinase